MCSTAFDQCTGIQGAPADPIHDERFEARDARPFARHELDAPALRWRSMPGDSAFA